jgi:hypothetical protein
MKTVEEKLDLLIQDTTEIKLHLAVYNEQLKYHIKRTNTLEKIVFIILTALVGLAFLALRH